MIVCHCNAVTDRAIKAAVDQGACEINHVADVCGAGTECGGCHRTIARILEQCTPVPVLLRLAS